MEFFPYAYAILGNERKIVICNIEILHFDTRQIHVCVDDMRRKDYL